MIAYPCFGWPDSLIEDLLLVTVGFKDVLESFEDKIISGLDVIFGKTESFVCGWEICSTRKCGWFCKRRNVNIMSRSLWCRYERISDFSNKWCEVGTISSKRAIHSIRSINTNWSISDTNVDYICTNSSTNSTVAQLVAAWQPGCEKMEREWENKEEMEREWGNGERFILYMFSFFLYFLPLYPFPISKIVSFCRKMLKTAL